MAEFVYVGVAGGIEEAAVPAAGVPLLLVPLVAPDSFSNRVRFIAGLLVSVAKCVQCFWRFRPNVLFSTGGFASLPATLSAFLLRVPVVIFLPDIRPGRAVRATRRLATRIAVSSQETLEHLGGSARVSVTGYPVRNAFLQVRRQESRSLLGLTEKDLQLLVMGGSQGSQAINGAIEAILPACLSLAQVFHVCGPKHFNLFSEVKRALPASLGERYILRPSLTDQEMAEAMAASDLGVTRAGASTLGELPMALLPAVMIPLPINAQDENARMLADAGAAVLLSQEEALSGGLEPILLELLGNAERRDGMRECLQRLRRPTAASDIAALVADVAAGTA